MQLENSFVVEAPIEKVWGALGTPDLIAACFPGATLTGYSGDTFTGVVGVKLGPIRLKYQGQGTYRVRDWETGTVVIEAHGRDSRGNGTVELTMTGTVIAQIPERTVISAVTDVIITGRPEQFGRGVIADVVDKIIGQFASCVAEKLAVQQADRAPLGPGWDDFFEAGTEALVPPSRTEQLDWDSVVDDDTVGTWLPARSESAEPVPSEPDASEWESAGGRARDQLPTDPPAGWYVDVDRSAAYRFWNGSGWTGGPQDVPDLVFVSYASKDADAVHALVEDLRAAQVPVWLDEELTSGQAWWDRILDRIRASVVFLHAISDSSLLSEPCRIERAYAAALGIPVLSVQVADANLRASPLGQQQMVDYRVPTGRRTARLIADFLRARGRWRPLPDPLPPAPPAPFGYVLRISGELDAEHLSFADQNRILQEVLGHLEDAAGQDVEDDILQLLRKLTTRPDAGRQVMRMVEFVLGSAELGTTRSGPDDDPWT